MLKSEDLYLLKQALNNYSKSLDKNNRTNRILAIANLITAGVLTHEQALNDKEYREFIESMTNVKDNSEPIKATIRR